MPWLSPRLHFLSPFFSFPWCIITLGTLGGVGPGPTLTSHREDGEQGWEGFSTLAGFLEGAGGSLKMNSFRLSEHLQGLAVAAS